MTKTKIHCTVVLTFVAGILPAVWWYDHTTGVVFMGLNWFFYFLCVIGYIFFGIFSTLHVAFAQFLIGIYIIRYSAVEDSM